MARPTKVRKIEHIPPISYFVPVEDKVEGVEVNVLLIEEAEAIRLKDLEGLEQAECAKRMGVSRPTFQRILLSAREKIADVIINGKAIHINGGNYAKDNCNVVCENCNNKWIETSENLKLIKEGNYTCKSCGSTKVTCIKLCKGSFCSKNCCDNI